MLLLHKHDAYLDVLVSVLLTLFFAYFDVLSSFADQELFSVFDGGSTPGESCLEDGQISGE